MSGFTFGLSNQTPNFRTKKKTRKFVSIRGSALLPSSSQSFSSSSTPSSNSNPICQSTVFSSAPSSWSSPFQSCVPSDSIFSAPASIVGSSVITAVNEATRSQIFKNMLDSDSCKTPASDTITLPELNSEELESLLEFLYSGSLPLEKLEKHVYSLFIAADKYEIPYLQEFCQCYMLNSLNASSVLDVLETSEVCSNNALKEIALKFISRNMEDVVLSEKYEALAAKNPQLCMQITRAFFMNARCEKVKST